LSKRIIESGKVDEKLISTESELLIPGFPHISQKVFHYNLSEMPSLNSNMYNVLENTLLDERIKGKSYKIINIEKNELYFIIKKIFD